MINFKLFMQVVGSVLSVLKKLLIRIFLDILFNVFWYIIIYYSIFNPLLNLKLCFKDVTILCLGIAGISIFFTNKYETYVAKAIHKYNMEKIGAKNEE